MYDYGRWAVGGGNGLSTPYGEHEEYEERPIDTIVMIGVVGSGKSTLGNILAIRDDQPNIPSDPDEQIFQANSGEKSKCNMAKVVVTASNLITAGR